MGPSIKSVLAPPNPHTTESDDIFFDNKINWFREGEGWCGQELIFLKYIHILYLKKMVHWGRDFFFIQNQNSKESYKDRAAVEKNMNPKSQSYT